MSEGTTEGSVPVEGVEHLAGRWVVVDDGSAPAPVVGTVRLEVSADGRVLAETGCNRVRGTATVADGRLVTGPLVSTRMACPPPLMEQERWVSEMLGARPWLELDEPHLALHWGDGRRWCLRLRREGATEPTA